MIAAARPIDPLLEAQERERLALEAIEEKDREIARLNDQLVAERTRRADVEEKIEVADKLAYGLFGAVADLCNATTRAKITSAQPISAGVGAGV